MSRIIFFLFFVIAAASASAQDSAVFNQRIGACDTQKVSDKRSKCFEEIAREAVAKLEQVAQMSTTSKDPVQPVTTPTSKYSEFVLKAKTNIAGSLRDPSAVQWRGLFVSGSNVLCGEMNGKNAYGAYIGFRRFYVMAAPEKMHSEIESQANNNIFNGMFGIFCTGGITKEITKIE